jgi:formylglycine-generating enzyme required for sulfatase activity
LRLNLYDTTKNYYLNPIKEHTQTMYFMTKIVASLLLAILVTPAMAQRKYNKTSTDSLPIYVTPVQGGSFDLGSNSGSDDRKPAHTVNLKDYSIGTYEVSQYQWKKIMGTNPSEHQCDECPVTNVSWSDAQAFIEKLNSQTGRHYRLPTEAEWEYAARGGVKEDLVKERSVRGGVNEFLVADEYEDKRVPDKMKTGKKYAGKNLPGDVAWFLRNSKDHVHPVGRKKPNDLGIYDMSGNVEEWCADWYGKNYGSKNTIDNPKGPSAGKSHVVRGGSVASGPAELAVTRRAAYLPDTKAATLGFRLAEDK